MPSSISLGRARPIRESNDNITVKLSNGKQVTVAKDQIHEDSEVFELRCGPGLLVVNLDYAQKEGLIGP